MIVAADDAFVVPVPLLMKAIGFFKAASNPSIAASERDQILQGSSRRRRPAGPRSPSAAPGARGSLKATSEQNAINDALGDCVKRDSDCHVIAIGPFVVGPN